MLAYCRFFVSLILFICFFNNPVKCQQPFVTTNTQFLNNVSNLFNQQGQFQGQLLPDGAIDRRAPDGWWTLYPFGEIYNDLEVWDRPNHDTQIDLDFYFPYYGFRFNYTFIVPNGIVAFSRPDWIQPPYTFPNPKWPDRSDGSFIAPYFAMASFQNVGETGISHVWYRTIHRPKNDIDNVADYGRRNQQPTNQVNNPFSNYGQSIKRDPGIVEDSYLLDNITADIQNGVNGANGFRALHALVVTWERMAFGGAPKVVEIEQFEEAKKWQNTYQLVLASDEIRSYVIFNYAYLNWTSSRESGSISGRGGYQSAIAGFNGGNATGFTPLPYSGEGDIFKLSRFSSVSVPGRWTYRVDEQIIFGGCSNASIGYMTVAPDRATMLGGLAVNVSGMCFRASDTVVVLFDEFLVNCKILNTHRARCMLPKFHKVGMINAKLSRDGGAQFPFITTFFIVPPDRAAPGVILRKDVLDYLTNAFDNPTPDELVLTWAPYNLTGNVNARVTVDLWGYWEDNEKHVFEKVATVAENLPNTGEYAFNPKLLQRINEPALRNKFKQFEFGNVRVSVAGDPNAGVLYSMVTSFAWFFVKDWEAHYGEDWALQRCIDWFENDGKWRNVWMDMDPCPCTLDQAVYDFARFMPFLECDMTGDGGCYFHRGAQHCVMGVHATWSGAQTVCCYDFEGWLMHSDDYESLDVIKYYSPGVPYRAHIFGSYPYKVPPYIPTMSNWMHDVGPYHMCCRFAGRCEFLMWRRQTHGCQGYLPPASGFAYGDTHFITFDGTQYTFNGKGYYVLAMSDHPWNKLMVQIRLEQPPKNLWGIYPNATIITGVAVQENDSDVVQVLARKEFRRWRYRMDVLVRGIPRFFDTPDMKVQMFRGLHVWSPSRNFDQSEIHIQLKSGGGVKVSEENGMLEVHVELPKSYNASDKTKRFIFDTYQTDTSTPPVIMPSLRPQDYYKTYGLLGVYNEDYNDDLLPLDSMSPVRTNQYAYRDSRKIYYEFAQKWRVDGSNPFIGPILFQDSSTPINNPLSFSDRNYEPDFDVSNIPANVTRVKLLNINQVRGVCSEHPACLHDYLVTGKKEIAQRTLKVQEDFLGSKDKGAKIWVSCGALLKAFGATKSPPGNNYLHGATVTFGCRPEYFMHGSQSRTCVNGMWTPGWHVWCRLRSEETALKWVTGVLSTIAIVGSFVALFACCFYMNKRVRENKMDRATGLYSRLQSLVSEPPDLRKLSLTKAALDAKIAAVSAARAAETDANEANGSNDEAGSAAGSEDFEETLGVPKRNVSRVNSRDTLLRSSFNALPDGSPIQLQKHSDDSDEIVLIAEPSKRKSSNTSDYRATRSRKTSKPNASTFDTQRPLLSDDEPPHDVRSKSMSYRKKTWSPNVLASTHDNIGGVDHVAAKKYSLSALENQRVAAQLRPNQVRRKTSMKKAVEGEDTSESRPSSSRSGRKASTAKSHKTTSSGEVVETDRERRKSQSAKHIGRSIESFDDLNRLSSSKPSVYSSSDAEKGERRKNSMNRAQESSVIDDNEDASLVESKKSSIYIADIPGTLAEAASVYPDLALDNENEVHSGEESEDPERFEMKSPTSPGKKSVMQVDEMSLTETNTYDREPRAFYPKTPSPYMSDNGIRKMTSGRGRGKSSKREDSEATLESQADYTPYVTDEEPLDIQSDYSNGPPTSVASQVTPKKRITRQETLVQSDYSNGPSASASPQVVPKKPMKRQDTLV